MSTTSERSEPAIDHRAVERETAHITPSPTNSMLLVQFGAYFFAIALAGLIVMLIHDVQVAAWFGMVASLACVFIAFEGVTLAQGLLLAGSRWFALRSVGASWQVGNVWRFAILRSDRGLSLLRVGPWRRLNGTVIPLYLDGEWREQAALEILVLQRTQLMASVGSGLLAFALGFVGLLTPYFLLSQITLTLAAMLLVDCVLTPVSIGKRIRAMRLVPEYALALILLGNFGAKSANGVRPRDLPIEEIAMLSDTLDDHVVAVSISLFRFYHMLDSGNFDEAEALLIEMLALVDTSGIFIDFAKGVVVREAAFFYAYIRGDAVAGRLRLKGVHGTPMLRHSMARIESAVLHAEGRLVEARNVALAGLEAAERSIDPGMAVFDRQFLEQIVNATGGSAVVGAQQ